MKFSIQELEAFTVIGQEIELSNYQNRNIQITKKFWREFNINLKKSYLSQSGNWIKYAFMKKREDQLFYYCAIPKKTVVPDGFILEEIPTYRYLVAEHIGSMDDIYTSYNEIYKNILPNEKYAVIQNDFLHFEKYDYRFRWNNANSIIEIWVPIQNGNSIVCHI